MTKISRFTVVVKSLPIKPCQVSGKSTCYRKMVIFLYGMYNTRNSPYSLLHCQLCNHVLLLKAHKKINTRYLCCNFKLFKHNNEHSGAKGLTCPVQRRYAYIKWSSIRIMNQITINLFESYVNVFRKGYDY
jgi:hypothetical protein